MRKGFNNYKILLYILFFYVLFQLIWWGILLNKLNIEIFELKKLLLMHHNSEDSGILTVEMLNQKLLQRQIMIMGEGFVFTTILCLGIYRLFKVLKFESLLNKQQRNFTLSITHELKSPLASARLQLETILKRNPEKLKQDQLLNNAISEIDRLNLLTDNILTTAQLENNNYSIVKENIDVVEVAQQVVNSARLKSPSRKIEIKGQSSIIHFIDKISFVSIINNLLENAIKYSNSTIELHLEKKSGHLILKVSDFGIGIPDEEKKEIFKKFYRVGNEETRTTKGTGLGLYIIKELVEIQKGSIKVSDNTPSGIVFEVVL